MDAAIVGEEGRPGGGEAQSSSDLSWRQALNSTMTGGPSDLEEVLFHAFTAGAKASRSCNMNELLPLPHSPSMEMVSGPRVRGFVRKVARA